MRGQGLLVNRRLLTVALLGLSSALPLALTGSTLQAWFTEAGMSLTAVGAVSLLGLPYFLKFLWSPLIDHVMPPFLGRRRGWIILSQASLCIALFLLAHLEPNQQSTLMGIVALLIAFISASQDIAIDAYRTDALLPIERGMGSAYYIFAYRAALLISGGLALILADYVGWRITYELMALLMGLCMIISLIAPETPMLRLPSNSLKSAILSGLRELGHREGIVFILLFIVCYKLGDALALSLMSNFLLRTLGFSLTEVGFAYKTVGLIGTIGGALLGGILVSRFNLYKALLWFGLAQACSNVLFMLLAIIGKHYLFMTSSIFIESVCSGMSTTALLVFLTSLCHPHYSATQFACLSAVSAVGRVFLGPVAGVLVAHLGWINFFGWTVLICFPGLTLLVLLRSKVNFYVEAMA